MVKLLHFIHLFISLLTKGFILVRLTVDLEHILGTLGVRQAIHHLRTHKFTHLFVPQSNLE